MERLRACAAGLAHPRRGNARRHEPLDILLIALPVTPCGAETCVGMAGFGLAKEGFLRQLLRLPGGIPCHDAFSRLYGILDLAACPKVITIHHNIGNRRVLQLVIAHTQHLTGLVLDR